MDGWSSYFGHLEMMQVECRETERAVREAFRDHKCDHPDELRCQIVDWLGDDIDNISVSRLSDLVDDLMTYRTKE